MNITLSTVIHYKIHWITWELWAKKNNIQTNEGSGLQGENIAKSQFVEYIRKLFIIISYILLCCNHSFVKHIFCWWNVVLSNIYCGNTGNIYRYLIFKLVKPSNGYIHTDKIWRYPIMESIVPWEMWLWFWLSMYLHDWYLKHFQCNPSTPQDHINNKSPFVLVMAGCC